MAKGNQVPIGPFHPLLEEPEFFKFFVEGEKIVDAEVSVGYNHRGIEKLAEAKTYDQDIFPSRGYAAFAPPPIRSLSFRPLKMSPA